MDFNDDELNDAIDSNIQAAIGHSRGRTLQSMLQAPPHSEADETTEDDADLDDLLSSSAGGSGVGAIGSFGG